MSGVRAREVRAGGRVRLSDTRGRGWRKHTKEEHNIWSYVYFLLLIEDKPKEECTGVEKFVKEQLEQK